MEKLKTVRQRERERDVEGLGVRVEMCHVCIEREKNLVQLCGCCLVGKKM